MEAFKDRLRGLKRARKLTEKEIARLCGVSSWSVTKWLKGPTRPRKKHMHSLATIFAVSVEFLETGLKDPGREASMHLLLSNLSHLDGEQIALLAATSDQFRRLNALENQ